MLALGDYLEAQCHACIGGTVVRDDINTLEAGVHVVVGTPGRVFDMIQRGALGKASFLCLKTVVRTDNLFLFLASVR